MSYGGRTENNGLSIWWYVYAAIVLSAGIYSGILFAGIFWAVIILAIGYYLKQRRIKNKSEMKWVKILLIIVAFIFVIIVGGAFLAAFFLGMAGTSTELNNNISTVTKCGDRSCPSDGVCCKGDCYKPIEPGYILDKNTCKIYPEGSVICGDGICKGECCLGKCYEPCPNGFARINKDDCLCYEKGYSTWNGRY